MALDRVGFYKAAVGNSLIGAVDFVGEARPGACLISVR